MVLTLYSSPMSRVRISRWILGAGVTNTSLGLNMPKWRERMAAYGNCDRMCQAQETAVDGTASTADSRSCAANTAPMPQSAS